MELSRRDYFASADMQGILSGHGLPDALPSHPGEAVNQAIAKIAVGLADALIEELDKRGDA